MFSWFINKLNLIEIIMCDFLGGISYCSNKRPHVQQYLVNTNYSDVETKDTMIARNGKDDKSWKNWRREGSYTQNTVENHKIVLSVATLVEDWLDFIVRQTVLHIPLEIIISIAHLWIVWSLKVMPEYTIMTWTWGNNQPFYNWN